MISCGLNTRLSEVNKTTLHRYKYDIQNIHQLQEVSNLLVVLATLEVVTLFQSVSAVA
jgi:hypothetical protein